MELETIRTFTDVDNLITRYGFMPLDETQLMKGYSIDRYSTPEWLYGSDIVATCSPHESYAIMSAYITPLLKDLPDAKIKKLLGYIRKHI